MKHFGGHFDGLLMLVGLSVINLAALSVTGRERFCPNRAEGTLLESV